MGFYFATTNALSGTTSTVGFFGATPAARTSAYTQTYATADRVHANPAAAVLSGTAGGTADTDLVSVPAVTAGVADAGVSSVNAAFSVTKNNLQDLAGQTSAIITDITDVKQLLNAVIDDLQAYGLFQ